MMRLIASASSVHHVDGDVALLAGFPRIPHAHGFARHRSRILGDALTVECRLGNLPLHPVVGTFGGDHPFAEQHLRAPHGSLFDEVIVLHNKHFADVVRMIQEDNVVPPDFVMRNVVILVSQVLEQRDRIRRTKLAPRNPKQVALESVRESV
jgi:hypothetical protein